MTETDIYGLLAFSNSPLCFLILNVVNISSFCMVVFFQQIHHNQQLQHVNPLRLAGGKGFGKSLWLGGGSCQKVSSRRICLKSPQIVGNPRWWGWWWYIYYGGASVGCTFGIILYHQHHQRHLYRHHKVLSPKFTGGCFKKNHQDYHYSIKWNNFSIPLYYQNQLHVHH